MKKLTLKDGLVLVKLRSAEPGSLNLAIVDADGRERFNIYCPGPDPLVLDGFAGSQPVRNNPELMRLLNQPYVLEVVEEWSHPNVCND